MRRKSFHKRKTPTGAPSTDGAVSFTPYQEKRSYA